MSVVRSFYDAVEIEGEGDEGKRFRLEYYLLEKSVMVGGFGISTFGVEVIKRTRIGQADAGMEGCRIYDVFRSRTESLEVLQKLARNAVTPVSLLDVLHDLTGVGDLVNEDNFSEPN